jgi:hypothetical protein
LERAILVAGQHPRAIDVDHRPVERSVRSLDVVEEQHVADLGDVSVDRHVGDDGADAENVFGGDRIVLDRLAEAGGVLDERRPLVVPQ